MKIINGPEREHEGFRPMRHVHHIRPEPPIPPHERKGMYRIELDADDWELFTEVFDDEDTPQAAVETILDAPPEIQIIVIQLVSIIKLVKASKEVK